MNRNGMLALLLGVATTAFAQGAKPMHVTGPFDVKTTPEAPAAAGYGRMAIAKQYHGPLDASASGEMLMGGDPKKGAAGYVALETVAGSLEGKQGTFQLMQLGTMDGGKRELRIAVVPGSGTGALSGITGSMEIVVAVDGKHSYTLEYALP
jgi:hypothetical protein